MPFAVDYREDEPTREEVDRTSGLMLLEFGASWCGHCRALSPTVEAMLENQPDVSHLRIADGRGKPLGRSFRVKLWPTLLFLRDGKVVVQLVRPTDAQVRQAFEKVLLSATDAGATDVDDNGAPPQSAPPQSNG